jgi:hypothetical protein
MATAELASPAHTDNASVLPSRPDKYRGAVVEVRVIDGRDRTLDLARHHPANLSLSLLASM